MTIYSELHDAVQRDGASDDVRSRVAGVLDDVVEGRLAIRAVRHPLGFVCLPVYRQGADGICVHVWTDGWRTGELTTSTVHCHSWELLSQVLYGELSNQIIQVVDSPDPTHRVFEVHSSAAGDTIRATGRVVRQQVTASSAYRAGDTYRLAAGVFHETVVPPARPTATVALGVTRPGTVDLSLGALRMPSHPVRREYCGREETVLAAAAVRRAVAGQRAPDASRATGG
jgi:hypothetical protein